MERRQSADEWHRVERVGGVVEGAMARRSTSSRAGVAGPTMTEAG
jgi:hypothetical protein